MEEKNQALQEKLDPKIIYKYDLREFRNDGFSKEIHLLRSGMELRERVFVALLMNIYRSALAAHFDVNLKPVILFKSRTIDESTGNRNDFVSFVDGLKATMLPASNKHVIFQLFGRHLNSLTLLACQNMILS